MKKDLVTGKNTDITGFSRRYVEMHEKAYLEEHRYDHLVEVQGRTLLNPSKREPTDNTINLSVSFMSWQLDW